MKKIARWIYLSVLSGLLSGLGATVLLHLLSWATQTRESTLALIAALPLAGFGSSWLYFRFKQKIATSPLIAAIFLLLSTLTTHLFGGSAGRETTAVHIGESLSDQLSRFFKLTLEEKRDLLMAGKGAGFGAAVGAPWAGAIFSIECTRERKHSLKVWMQCLIASMIGYSTTLLCATPHTQYPKVLIASFQLKTIPLLTIAALFFGVAAALFNTLTHFIEKNFAKLKYPPLRPFIGGLLLITLYLIIGNTRYAGLGLSTIQHTLQTPSPFATPLLKGLSTAVTLGSGFKGGAFIPLIFIGTTLGSALSLWIPLGATILAISGFSAVYGAAAGVPLTCIIMATELFGIRVAPYAFIACMLSSKIPTAINTYT